MFIYAGYENTSGHIVYYSQCSCYSSNWSVLHSTVRCPGQHCVIMYFISMHLFIYYCKKKDNVHATQNKHREVNQDYDVEFRILGHPVVIFFSHNKTIK